MINAENMQEFIDKWNKSENNYINEFSKFAQFDNSMCGLNFSKDNALLFEGLTDNILFFINYYSHFTNIALSRFKWNIDEKKYPMINSRYLELMLFYRGSVVIVNTKNGYIACNYTVVKNNYNSFFEPLEIEAKDFVSGKTIGRFKRKDFVIIRNNFIAYPTNLTVMRFCAQISNIDISAKINIFSRQMPILLQGDEKQKKTMQELVEKIELGERYIFAPKDSVVNDITHLDIREPFICKDLYDCKDRTINQLLTLLGINNENVNKESGISPSEVNGNDELVNLSADIYASARENAVAELKEKFDIDISFSDRYAKNIEMGGNEDVTIYDND